MVKGENPDLKLSEASKIIGTRWKMLSDKDKQVCVCVCVCVC